MEKTDVEIIQAAAKILIEPILRLIQVDPHHWSTRPCTTCNAVTAIAGQPFGCVLYAQERIKE